jgi:hypothetical protein
MNGISPGFARFLYLLSWSVEDPQIALSAVLVVRVADCGAWSVNEMIYIPSKENHSTQRPYCLNGSDAASQSARTTIKTEK